jgi:hypothetical protein
VIVGAALAFGYSVMTNRSKGLTPDVNHDEPSADGASTNGSSIEDPQDPEPEA